MNFEDTLKVGVKVYDDSIVGLGGNYYKLNDDGRIDYSAIVEDFQSDYDENGDPITATDVIYIDFGKCIIIPNQQAQKITLADGSTYQYSYEIIALLKNSLYSLIPHEGDRIWLTKKDKTINCECEVKGFVTLKRRYLKLWV